MIDLAPEQEAWLRVLAAAGQTVENHVIDVVQTMA